jgi:hypothetical protein
MQQPLAYGSMVCNSQMHHSLQQHITQQQQHCCYVNISSSLGCMARRGLLHVRSLLIEKL